MNISNIGSQNWLPTQQQGLAKPNSVDNNSVSKEDTAVFSSTANNKPFNFDFSNMTRREAIDAAMQLESMGLIDSNEVGIFLGASLDYVPIPGYELPLEYNIDSPIKRNYIELIAQSILYNGNNHGVDAQKSLLEKLSTLSA
jgi:hypothetical protein